MKVWKIVVITTLAVALVLGVTLPVLAASGATETVNNTDEVWAKWFPRIIRGEVTDIDNKKFIIQTGEREATIHVTEDTRYFIVSAPARVLNQLRTHAELRITTVSVPARLRLQVGLLQREGKTDEEPALLMPQRQGFTPNSLQLDDGQGMLQRIQAKLPWFHHPDKEVTFDDLQIGDTVVVLLAPPANDSLTAMAEEQLMTQVVFIIRPSTWNLVAGIIERLSDDAIFIEPVGGGNTVSLRYDENTTFILKGFTSVEVGQFTRAVYNTETMMARVVRVWPEAPPIPLPAE